MVFESYQSLLNFLGYDNIPNQVALLYDQFQNEDIKSPFIDNDSLKLVFLKLEFDEVHKKTMQQAYDIIINDAKLNTALHFLKYIMVIKAHPSHWYVKEPHLNHLNISKSVFQLMTLIAVIPHAIQTHQEKQIDEKHAHFNLGHFKNYVKNYFIKHQSVGIDNFGWCTYLATLGLVQLKSLNFMHHIYTDKFIVFKNKHNQERLILADQGLNIRRDGQIDGVNEVYDLDFITTYQVTEDHYKGYYVNPYGYVTHEMICLDKNTWVIELKPGDPVIDFHIPTKMGYKIDDIKTSFEAAKAFFIKHYPEYDYKSFWCISWLYSPQLHHLVKKETSNIIHVARQGYICPATPGEKSLFTFVFQTETPDFSNLKPRTSLEDAVMEYVSKDGKINTGLYLYMLSDVKQFGQTPYIKTSDTQTFLKRYAQLEAGK